MVSPSLEAHGYIISAFPSNNQWFMKHAGLWHVVEYHASRQYRLGKNPYHFIITYMIIVLLCGDVYPKPLQSRQCQRRGSCGERSNSDVRSRLMLLSREDDWANLHHTSRRRVPLLVT